MSHSSTPKFTLIKKMATKAADVQGSATVDWNPLGDIYVKKYTNYDLPWQVKLNENLVAIAPYGGPIALFPKTAGRKGSGKAVLSVYTQAGELIESIPWEGGRIIGLGWTSSENLVCVLDEGTMVVYNLHGERVFTRPIAREIREDRALECKFFHTLEGSAGFAVMTNKYEFFVVGDSDRSRDEIRANKLAGCPNTTTRPSCWAILPQPSGNQQSVIVAVEDRLYLLDTFEAVPQSVVCKKDPPLYWTQIAVSTNGRAVALVDKEGFIWGGSTDFKTCETTFDLQSGSKILQMEWGGKDFFVIVMDQLMFVKGTGKHWCKYPLREVCFLQPEIDGVRILTESQCEFMHRVTSNSLAVLRIGSMEVGALLNDAYKEFEGDESHKADEYIRFIKDRLPDAVTQCIKAAGEEFDPLIQQSLLTSANFGKGFLGSEVPREVVNDFVETCQQLRVLNCVRDKCIGIPITFRQYYRLSTGVLIDRLINRELYPLAIEISSYLKLPPNDGEVKVLREWALKKVKDMDASDDKVAMLITEKLQRSFVVVPFAEIARAARAIGRNRLAALLLDHEVHAKDQVPLLMDMKKADVALDKAIESGDPQLVYKVLEELKYKHFHSQMDRYLHLFHHRPVAAALYRKLCKETDQEQLLSLYVQESDFLEAGCLHFARSYMMKTAEDSRHCLGNAMKEFRDGQHLFHLKAAEEQSKLHTDQLEIEKRCGFKVLGLPLFNTVLECVKNRQLKIAEQLRKDFRMTDTQFWWAKLRGLAHIGDYDELEKFSKQKKSPIGYEPFARVCLANGNRREAAKYIARVPPEAKFQLYMAIDDYQKAAEAAFQNRSIEDLEEVQAKVIRHPDLLEQVQLMKTRLGYK